MCLSGSAWGQAVISAKAGLISYVEGKVDLDGKALELSRTNWTQIADGSILTTHDGRVEVLVNPCVVLHLDGGSSLRMMANRLVDARLELLTGSAMAQADGAYQKSGVTVTIRETPVLLGKKGLSRLDVEPPELRVFSGSANLDRPGGLVAVGAGWGIGLADGASPVRLGRKQSDALEAWSKRRVAELARISGQGRADARDSRDLAAAATQAATVNAEVRDPEHPRFKAREQPGASEFPAIRSYLQERARFCAASR
jgi:hypothetical protein